MKNIKAILIMLILLISNGLYATHIEYFDGNYTYIGQNLSINFNLCRGDISKIIINENIYTDSDSIYCEFMGFYKGLAIFEIKVNVSKCEYDLIYLICLFTEDRVLMSSGLYSNYKIEKNGILKLQLKRTFEFEYTYKSCE